jgi:hypothetical protein
MFLKYQSLQCNILYKSIYNCRSWHGNKIHTANCKWHVYINSLDRGRTGTTFDLQGVLKAVIWLSVTSLRVRIGSPNFRNTKQAHPLLRGHDAPQHSGYQHVPPAVVLALSRVILAMNYSLPKLPGWLCRGGAKSVYCGVGTKFSVQFSWFYQNSCSMKQIHALGQRARWVRWRLLTKRKEIQT